MKKSILILMFTLITAGCSTMQVSPYVDSNDWQALGERDALTGRWPRDVTQLTASELETAQYADGYQIGKIAYCEPKNAWQLGRIGKPYNGICQDLLHGWGFEQDYKAGRERWLLH